MCLVKIRTGPLKPSNGNTATQFFKLVDLQMQNIQSYASLEIFGGFPCKNMLDANGILYKK